MALNESETSVFSSEEVLSANDRVPLLSERTKSKMERALVLSSAVLALITWAAQPLAEEPSPVDIIKRELGASDLTAVNEVHQVNNLYGCPNGEDATKQPDNLETIRSFLSQEDSRNWDFGEYAVIDGSTAFGYSDGGMDEAVYCGQSVGTEVYSGNAPEGTVLIVPGMHANTWTGKFFCTYWDDRC